MVVKKVKNFRLRLNTEVKKEVQNGKTMDYMGT